MEGNEQKHIENTGIESYIISLILWIIYFVYDCNNCIYLKFCRSRRSSRHEPDYEVIPDSANMGKLNQNTVKKKKLSIR